MEREAIIPLKEPDLVRQEDFSSPGIYRIRRWKSSLENSRLLPRYLYIYLPKGYFLYPEKKFPVLYLQDGQHVWDREKRSNGGWKLEKSLKKGAAEGTIPEVIAVAAGNTVQRWEEYIGFFKSQTPYNIGDKVKGLKLSQDYTRFFTEELVPWIDRRFRTLADREHRGIMGSSNGAAVSFHIASLYPEIFSRLALLSGNFLDVEQQWQEFSLQWDYRIWLDCGTKKVDEEFLPGNRFLHRKLEDAGYSPEQYRFNIFEGGDHIESDWAKRLPEILTFLWGDLLV